jgi:hypothetical protein
LAGTIADFPECGKKADPDAFFFSRPAEDLEKVRKVPTKRQLLRKQLEHDLDVFSSHLADVYLCVEIQNQEGLQ